MIYIYIYISLKIYYEQRIINIFINNELVNMTYISVVQMFY